MELDFSQLRLPEFKPPDGMTPEEYLEKLCRDGLAAALPSTPPLKCSRRLDYELDVIEKTQFANYMLVVWDIAAFTRKQGILFGVRGSAAASLVLYCLGVTDIDPLRHRLVFERFLNLERREMPDIDMDFQDDRRDEVIAYVRRKYGGDHVAQIITFGTLGAKAAIRDTGRALGMTFSDVDRVARLIPAKTHNLRGGTGHQPRAPRDLRGRRFTQEPGGQGAETRRSGAATPARTLQAWSSPRSRSSSTCRFSAPCAGTLRKTWP